VEEITTKPRPYASRRELDPLRSRCHYAVSKKDDEIPKEGVTLEPSTWGISKDNLKPNKESDLEKKRRRDDSEEKRKEVDVS